MAMPLMQWSLLLFLLFLLGTAHHKASYYGKLFSGSLLALIVLPLSSINVILLKELQMKSM